MAHKYIIIAAGQSNAQGHGTRAQLDPVADYNQLPDHGWEGHPTRSADTNIAYRHPTAAGDTTHGDPFPALHIENDTGLMAGVYDAWGTYFGESPRYDSGVIAEVSNYGPELTFVLKYHAQYPDREIVTIKQVLGGSSISDWVEGEAQWNILEAMVTQAEARLTAAGHTWEYVCLLWMQGESGAHNIVTAQDDSVFRASTRAFYASVRTLTNTPNLPVVMGLIGDNWINTNPYLVAQGIPYAAIDFSIVDQGFTVTPQNRADRLAGAIARRASQIEIATDANVYLWNNDGLEPYYVDSDHSYYHNVSSAELAKGERAWDASPFSEESPATTTTLCIGTSAGALAIGVGA